MCGLGVQFWVRSVFGVLSVIGFLGICMAFCGVFKFKGKVSPSIFSPAQFLCLKAGVLPLHKRSLNKCVQTFRGSYLISGLSAVEQSKALMQ